MEIIPDLKPEAIVEAGDPEEEILLVEMVSKVVGLAASKGFATRKLFFLLPFFCLFSS